MSGPMGYGDPLPPWWVFILAPLLIFFVGLPLFMVVVIAAAKWIGFVLTWVFG